MHRYLIVTCALVLAILGLLSFAFSSNVSGRLKGISEATVATPAAATSVKIDKQAPAVTNSALPLRSLYPMQT